MGVFFDKISYHRMHKNIFVLIISENLICRWSNIISDIQQTSRTHEPFCREPRGWGCYPRCPDRRSPPWPRRRSRTSASGEYIYSGRMLQWWSAHHVQLLVILLETFRRGIVHCHQTFFSIQFVNYFRSWASIFILQYFNIRLSPEAVKGLWRIYLFVFLEIVRSWY